MFGSIGMPELIIIFVIALIIFGPRKLPELGKSLGRSLSEFKRASNELRSTLEEEIKIADSQGNESTKSTGNESTQSKGTDESDIKPPSGSQTQQSESSNSGA